MIPIFYYGFTGYADKLAAPQDSEEITVTGKKWDWSFTYSNGAEPQGELVHLTKTGKGFPEFVVPEHRPVKLIMSSRDVIHAFYIPDFRTKMDVIPNRYTSMWFYPEKLTNERDPTTKQLRDPTQPENPPHKVFCAEYCGQDHSDMMAQLRVVTEKEFNAIKRKWTDYAPDTTILKVGEKVFSRKGCNACHTVDGAPSTGPTWKNMFGNKHEYTDGTSDTVTENTLRSDILYSQKRIMKGFPTSMPIFAGQISPLELDAVILYIKSLSEKDKAAAEREGAKTYGEAKSGTPAAGGAAPAPANAPAPKQ
jgi:cytochrome c oxidase subunit 2